MAEDLGIRQEYKFIARSAHTSMRQWAFYLVVLATFLSPYVWWRVSSAFFITVSDLLFFSGAVLLLLSGRFPMQPRSTVMIPWLLAFATMLFGLFASSLLNSDPMACLTMAAQYVFAYLFIPALLILFVRPSASMIFAAASLWGVFLMQVIGVLLYFAVDGSHTALSALAPDFISGARRLGAFTNEANWNGAIIAMAVPLLIYFRCTGKLGVLPTLVAAAILGAGLILSASVTGLVATLAAVLAFCIAAKIHPPFRILILFAAGAGLLYGSGYEPPQAFEKRVAPALKTGDIEEAGTFTGRIALMQEAWGIVEHTALIGLGADQYRKVSALGAPVHNVYLLLWAEGGLISLLGWLAMMVIMAAECGAARHYDRFRGALGFGVLAAFLVLSVAAPHMYARIWIVPLVVAMAVVLDRQTATGPLGAISRFARQ